MNLKEMLAQGQVVAAGAYDCFSSRVMRYVGYQAVVLYGGALSGMSDARLTTIDDVCWTGLRMVLFEDGMPVLADIKNGFGDSLANITHSLKHMSRVGLQGAIIDDTENVEDYPRYIPIETWKKRIKTAVEAKGNLLIIAAIAGRYEFNERLYRARIASELGADLVCIRHLTTIEQIKAFSEEVPCDKLWFDSVDCNNAAIRSDELEKFGFKMVLQCFAEASTKWGMKLFAEQTYKDRNTVFHDSNTYDGMIPGGNHRNLYDFNHLWIPRENSLNDLSRMEEKIKEIYDMRIGE